MPVFPEKACSINNPRSEGILIHRALGRGPDTHDL